MPLDDSALLGLVNGSGYPFQSRVAELVRETTGTHGWTVVAEEYPWSHEGGHTGFADLVLRHAQGTDRFVIECKRLGDPATYVFLPPRGRAEQVDKAHGFWTYHPGNEQPARSGWTDFHATPTSPTGLFCVVPGRGERDRPIVERLASELIHAVEAIALDEVIAGQRKKPRIYFPVLVTTADLVVCDYAVNAVDVETGTLPDGTFTRVPMVRLRKGLGDPSPASARYEEFAEILAAKERTVMVVQARYLPEMLNLWNWTERQFRFSDYPWNGVPHDP